MDMARSRLANQIFQRSYAIFRISARTTARKRSRRNIWSFCERMALTMMNDIYGDDSIVANATEDPATTFPALKGRAKLTRRYASKTGNPGSRPKIVRLIAALWASGRPCVFFRHGVFPGE